MNGNKSTNSSIPLFYIIQPKIQLKQVKQNMQEIFHGRENPDIESIEENKKEAIRDEGVSSETDLSLNTPPIEVEKTVTGLDESQEFMDIEKMESGNQIDAKLQVEEGKNELINVDALEISTSEKNDNGFQGERVNALETKSIELEEQVRMMDTNSTEVAEHTLPSVEGNRQYRKELRAKLIRLARYPAVVPKPLCEMKLKDEVLKGIIISKRGEQLKIKVDNITSFILIDDIEEVTVID